MGFLFYRFISENLAGYIDHTEHAAGDPDLDYRYQPCADAEYARAGIVEEKGFFILPEELFDNVREHAALPLTLEA